MHGERYLDPFDAGYLDGLSYDTGASFRADAKKGRGGKKCGMGWISAAYNCSAGKQAAQKQLEQGRAAMAQRETQAVAARKARSAKRSAAAKKGAATRRGQLLEPVDAGDLLEEI